MRSTDFINEFDDEDVDPKLAKKYATLIKRDCQPFLSQSKGLPLYRGLGHATEDMYKKSIRLNNRTPKDMPLKIHNKLNQYFLMKHGAKFRNALFVSGDDSVASEYGSLYRVFPIGNFEFLWSPMVSDLYTEWEDYDPGYNWNRDSEEMQAEKYKKSLKKFHDDILKSNYTTSNLPAAINSRNEIMLRGKQYYALEETIADSVLGLINAK